MPCNADSFWVVSSGCTTFWYRLKPPILQSWGLLYIYIFIHITVISCSYIPSYPFKNFSFSQDCNLSPWQWPSRWGAQGEWEDGRTLQEEKPRGSWRSWWSWGLGTSESVFFAIWLGLNGHFWGLILGKVDNFGEVGAVFSTVAPAECGWTVAQGVFPPCKVSGKGSQPPMETQAMKQMGWSNTCFNIMRQWLLVWKLPTLVTDTCEIHETIHHHYDSWPIL